MDNFIYLKESGIKIFASPYVLQKDERYQFKFPKSRKRRIRNKWAKNNHNYKTKLVETAIKYDNNTILVSEATFNKLKNIQ